jgi:hypothetical protein
MRAAISLALTILLLVQASLCLAEIYTWRDADGRLNYSDTPPPNVDAKKVRDAGASGNDDAALAERKAAAEKEAAFRKRQTDANDATAKASADKQQSEQRQTTCVDARAQLQGIESGQIRFKTGPNGERIGLDGALREEELARARKAVESFCR